MESYLGISVAILALVSTLIYKQGKYLQIIMSLLLVSLLFVLMKGFEEDPSVGMISYTMYGMVFYGLVVSFLAEKWRKFLPYTVGLLALIPIGAKAVYQEFVIVWGIEVASFAIAGSLVPLLVDVKTKIATRFFHVENQAFSKGVLLLFFGIFAFAATFFASTFGLILFATGFTGSMIAKRSLKDIQIAVAVFSLCWMLFSFYELEGVSDSLLKGNLWMGILVGVGAFWLSRSFAKNERWMFLGWIIPLFIIAFVTSFGFLNEHFGGITTWIGAIIGTSIALALQETSNEKPLFIGTFIPFFLIGLTFTVHSIFQKPKEVVNTLIPKTQTSEKEVDPMSLPAIPIQATGTWKSLADNSNLTFELGPVSTRTEGKFTQFEVALTFDEASNPTTIDVTIDATSLTTFNSMRDESVLSDDFIKSTKHPKAHYTSSSIRKEGENYFAKGVLDFVGQKIDTEIEFRFVSTTKKDGKTVLVFVGKSVIDRTKHDMKSDPKIGDLVDVRFEVALNQ